jgi:hypothetical protein
MFLGFLYKIERMDTIQLPLRTDQNTESKTASGAKVGIEMARFVASLTTTMRDCSEIRDLSIVLRFAHRLREL